jgi:hypothetical protein
MSAITRKVKAQPSMTILIFSNLLKVCRGGKLQLKATGAAVPPPISTLRCAPQT